MSFQTRLLASFPADLSANLPELLQFNQYNPARYPYLLSSSASRQDNTQYDILLACPLFSLTLDADKNLHCSNKHLPLATGFFETLENFYQKNQLAVSPSSENLPFTGGWFVYLCYEMAEEIEPTLKLPPLPKTQLMACATRCPAAIIVDKKNRQLIAVAETQHSKLLDKIEQDYIALKNQLKQNSPETQRKEQSGDKPTAPHKIKLKSLVEADAAPYLQQVEKIKQYIFDGDIFQANLSRLWQAELKPLQAGRDDTDHDNTDYDNTGHDVTDAQLFAALSKQNPSSFAALACLPNMSIISSSPERLVSVKNAIVETRPIAGTRPRDKNKQSDQALAKELLSHPKEQAEHIMLIDLERNDLGRVCRPGSIEVNELMVLESWQHVHHIVSNVRGELASNKSPVDVLRAVFPGGTITGCPKVRCMEILSEVEQQARGAYTGSLGYINNDGSMDFNILIRTMVRDHKNGITFRAGGGIVNDSVAANELEETRAKAKGLLQIFNLKFLTKET